MPKMGPFMGKKGGINLGMPAEGDIDVYTGKATFTRHLTTQGSTL